MRLECLPCAAVEGAFKLVPSVSRATWVESAFEPLAISHSRAPRWTATLISRSRVRRFCQNVVPHPDYAGKTKKLGYLTSPFRQALALTRILHERLHSACECTHVLRRH